jgi:hypothetical protein
MFWKTRFLKNMGITLQGLRFFFKNSENTCFPQKWVNHKTNQKVLLSFPMNGHVDVSKTLHFLDNFSVLPLVTEVTIQCSPH